MVNLDDGVTLDDQFIPLGRQLSADLVDSGKEQNFTWVLADEAHAWPGLASGRYAAVVVIPENFSAAATSYGNDDPLTAEQATIARAHVAGGRRRRRPTRQRAGQRCVPNAQRNAHRGLPGPDLHRLQRHR